MRLNRRWRSTYTVWRSLLSIEVFTQLVSSIVSINSSSSTYCTTWSCQTAARKGSNGMALPLARRPHWAGLRPMYLVATKTWPSWWSTMSSDGRWPTSASLQTTTQKRSTPLSTSQTCKSFHWLPDLQYPLTGTMPCTLPRFHNRHALCPTSAPSHRLTPY